MVPLTTPPFFLPLISILVLTPAISDCLTSLSLIFALTDFCIVAADMPVPAWISLPLTPARNAAPAP